MVEYHHSTELPWVRTPAERKRSRLITQTVLAIFLLVAVILPIIDVPELDRDQARKLPPRFAKLIVEKQVPKVQPPEPEPEPKKEEKKPEKKKEVKKEKKKEPEKKPEPEPEVDVAAAAREKASRSGLLAMADELADLRDVPDVPQVNMDLNKKPAPEAPEPEMLTMKRASSSAGIDRTRLARASRPTRSLSDRNTRKVDDAIERAVEDTAPKQKISIRTLEQIRLVVERYKGALNRLHTMALRRDPTIEGDVTLEIAIAARGNVTSCKVVSSSFEAPRFLRRIETKCRSFDFGPAAQDMTINYPLNFAPLS